MKKIEVEELVNNIDKYIIIDLRSPLEYEEGTIKGAFNIPLLNNEARKFIGTLYKENQEEAYKEGLKIGTSKLPEIYDEVLKLKKKYKKEIVFFCFRGGTRSSSVHTMMEILKVDSLKLNGGYKAYRTYILENLDKNLKKINWLVLTGNTGSGKTIILNDLEKQNIPVIDLEGLANHRGSVFGDVGLKGTVTQKDFEDKLFYETKEKTGYVFIESESRRIGGVTLPNAMYDKMKTSDHIMIEVPVEKRFEIISDIYHPEVIEKEKIKSLINNNECFKKIKGNEWVSLMNNLIDEENYNLFIEKMLVDYYDKLYLKSHANYNYVLKIENNDLNKITEELKKYYKKNY